ncbi:MAG: PEP-CTERM sorting domain-containing protein [Acidobacteria bacterium]|nr:PEP-CTERM sorting domain-containing protein [Acidobacteriota bacterium]
MRLLLAALLAATSVHATPFSFAFTGQVNNISGFYSSGAAIGDLVDGSGSFDPASPDSDTDPNRYFHQWTSGPYQFQVNVHTSGGVLSFFGSTAGGLYMWNYDQVTFPPGGADFWQFTGFGPSSSPAFDAIVGGSGGHEISLVFKDAVAPYDMLDGVTPPNGLPDLNKATSYEAYVRSNYTGGFYIGFTFSPVPEPGTSVMACLALAGFGIWRRRRL